MRDMSKGGKGQGTCGVGASTRFGQPVMLVQKGSLPREPGLGWGEPGQVDLGCSTTVSRKRPGREKRIPRPNGGCSDVGRVLRTENLEQGER